MVAKLIPKFRALGRGGGWVHAGALKEHLEQLKDGAMRMQGGAALLRKADCLFYAWLAEAPLPRSSPQSGTGKR